MSINWKFVLPIVNTRSVIPDVLSRARRMSWSSGIYAAEHICSIFSRKLFCGAKKRFQKRMKKVTEKFYKSAESIR